ncbi:MAG: DUF2344 domain-containing protein [Clostridiales bacterium]|jgi:radical SAM-linked protein|nr:DUF2344 domain-containing protein [Clostridiales bacterium]
MLTFRFQKVGAAAFIPHVNAMRHITRAIRRAGIEAAYSQGFNPHMNVYLSPPMPLGFESLCEYCTVDTKTGAEEFMRLYNAHCLKGMECLEAAEVVANPNIAAAAAAALYEIEDPALIGRLDELQRGRFTVEEKDGGAEKDITEGVLAIERTPRGISALLKYGNMGNLRIDRFLEALARRIPDFKPQRVVKARLYCCDGSGEIIPAQQYISKILR